MTRQAESVGVFVLRSGGEPYRVSAAVDSVGIVWSPDGGLLALDRNDGDRSIVSVVGTDGSGERILVEGSAYEGPGDPVWSPDSNSVAYLRTPKDRGVTALEFWVISADGSERTQVGRFGRIRDAWDGPVWSPDSHMVAYSGNAIRWVVARADGSGAPEPIDRLEVERWRQG